MFKLVLAVLIAGTASPCFCLAATPPISIEKLESALDHAASSPGDKKLDAIRDFLAGVGVEIRLIKGDTVALPLDSAARLMVGEIEFQSKDGSRIKFKQQGVAALGYDGIWRVGDKSNSNRIRCIAVVSEDYFFTTDLESGLTSRVPRPHVPKLL